MNEGANELSRVVKEEEKRWGNCTWSRKEILFAGTTFVVYMFLKQEDRHACRIGAGQVTVSKGGQGNLCMESPIQEGKSIQTNTSEWLACITNVKSPFARKFSQS